MMLQIATVIELRLSFGTKAVRWSYRDLTYACRKPLPAETMEGGT